MNLRRFKWLLAGCAGGLVGITLATVAATAIAGHGTVDIKSFTGCVTRGGALTKIAEGSQPLFACARDEVAAHLSGGDITSISAGSGLDAEGTNGAVTFSIDAGFSLPQSCTAAQVPKKSNTDAWICGNDNDRTGSDAWQDRVGSPVSVSIAGMTLTTVAQVSVPAGSYLVTVSGLTTSNDDDVTTACGVYPSPSATSPVAVVGVEAEVGFLDVGPEGSIAMSGIVTGPATTIQLKCRATEDEEDFLHEVNLIATNLTSVTNQ